MDRRLFCLSAVVLPLLIAGCGVPDPNSPKSSSEEDRISGNERKAITPSDPAPEKFRVKFETSKGDVIVEVTRDWAPKGADRFYEAVKAGFYDDCRFFRVVPGFVVQFGINGDPNIQKKWRESPIIDEEVKKGNLKGRLTFAKGGPDSRTTQLFINLNNNSRLDGMGFPAFGEVVQGMDVVEKINSEYGEKPNQGEIQSAGNKYLNAIFPRLDYIKKATVISEQKPSPEAKTKTSAEKTAAKTKP